MRHFGRRIGTSLAVLGATFVLLGAALPLFRDLDRHWASPLIPALAARGLVSGFPDGTFRPEEPVTRAQLARLLVAATGRSVSVPAEARFRDARGHWAEAYIEAAAEAGLVRGYPDGLFRPERPVSRVEAVAMAVRAAGLGPPPGAAPVPFPDAARIPEWARGDVTAAAAGGLLRGIFPGDFDPGRGATRAEAAVLAARVAGASGGLYDMVGEVQAWDGGARRLTVRTPAGEVRVLRLADGAAVFRAGLPAAELKPLDQVWILLDSRGDVRYLEARYEDVLGRQATYRDGALRFSDREGRLWQVPVSELARVYVNGRPGTPGQVDGAQVVYVVLDAATGAARVVDAVRYTHRGHVARVDREGRRVWIVAERPVALRVAADAILIQGGERVPLERLHIGAMAMVAADGDLLRFLQVEPPGLQPAAVRAPDSAGPGAGTGSER